MLRRQLRSCGVRARIVPSLLGAALLASACDSSPSRVCTGLIKLQLVATVRDSVTGAAAATHAAGAMTGASVNDSLFPADSLDLVGALHTGVFTVTIDRPGYATWTASNVRVTKGPDACGSPVVAALDVRLQPVGP